jgi:hypothetical protein
MRRTARKEHTCYACDKPIPAGTRYNDERDHMRPGAAFRYHVGCGRSEHKKHRPRPLKDARVRTFSVRY